MLSLKNHDLGNPCKKWGLRVSHAEKSSVFAINKKTFFATTRVVAFLKWKFQGGSFTCNLSSRFHLPSHLHVFCLWASVQAAGKLVFIWHTIPKTLMNIPKKSKKQVPRIFLGRPLKVLKNRRPLNNRISLKNRNCFFCRPGMSLKKYSFLKTSCPELFRLNSQEDIMHMITNIQVRNAYPANRNPLGALLAHWWHWNSKLSLITTLTWPCHRQKRSFCQYWGIFSDFHRREYRREWRKSRFCKTC